MSRSSHFLPSLASRGTYAAATAVTKAVRLVFLGAGRSLYICDGSPRRHEERQFHVFNQVQMAVEALKSKLAPPSRDREAEAAAAEEVLKPDPNEVLRQRAAELLRDELHELDLCMALLAQEFADDAKEVEHFMTDARNPTEDGKPTADGDDLDGLGASGSVGATKESVGNESTGASKPA